MNKIIIRGRLFVLLAIVFGIALCSSVIAQKRTTRTQTVKKKTSTQNSKLRQTQNSILRDKNFVSNSFGCKNALNLVHPPYPPAAKMAGVSGIVSVILVIDKKGNVKEIETAYGHPLLRAAAINAARKSTFGVMTLSGTPVKVRCTLNFNFVE